MPYFITDKSPDCPSWATVKADGEVMGCHETKDDAIAQMVALSVDEGMEPGGELRGQPSGKHGVRSVGHRHRARPTA